MNIAITPRIRLRLVSDDPESLDRLFENVAFAKGMRNERVDFIMSNDGAADLRNRTREDMTKRGACRFEDYDEYEWRIAFHSQEARSDFIQTCRWIGAGITEKGIAIPASTAREIAVLMRP